MNSKYRIFCHVVESGSFTETARQDGYSQSAVSQMVRSLEQELGTALIDRKPGGVRLTRDGESYYPYFQAIAAAETSLERFHQEKLGLKEEKITIGCFTSVSRTILPRLMKDFRLKYPDVNYILRQGEYDAIRSWITAGSVDFGFTNAQGKAAEGLQTHELFRDDMVAVLPPGHPLAVKETVSIRAMLREPFILLDEGEYSAALAVLTERERREAKWSYEVYDDYTVMEMVRSGLGVSVMYRRVAEEYGEGLEIREIREEPCRITSLAWRDWKTMPHAAQLFARFIIREIGAGKRDGAAGL